jgi:pimeloyl-ACP methyl ester carboxylesterase
MNARTRIALGGLMTTISIAILPGCSSAHAAKSNSIVIEAQGSFAVGGTVVTAPGTFNPIAQGAYDPAGVDPAGQTLHGDHAAISYQIPADARKLPLVFWHGHGQSSRCWQTTPDGREGFQNIFLRRRFPVYLIDQPRRGHAARSTQPVMLTASPDEQLWFGIFRLGVWPAFYGDVQFSRHPAALDQFFRMMVPNTGSYNVEVNTAAVSSLFDKIGKGVLVTHSQSGALGWRTAVKNQNIVAIASYEPGGDFLFPEEEVPEPIPFGKGAFTPPSATMTEFMHFTNIPIVIYYGDNIPEAPTAIPGEEQWRVFLQVARLWAGAVNRHGGDATVVHLPEIGIRGNTHFPFSDLNNMRVADQLSNFLKAKKLD